MLTRIYEILMSVKHKELRVKPGFIGTFPGSLLQIRISPVVVALDDPNGQRIEVYSIRGQREANLACLSSSR